FLAPKNAEHSSLPFFADRFETFLYETWEEADEWLREKNVDVLHMRKAGENDGVLSKHCRNVVHCAFPNMDPHGDVYCYISEWLAHRMNSDKWIPHIVEKPIYTGDLR